MKKKQVIIIPIVILAVIAVGIAIYFNATNNIQVSVAEPSDKSNSSYIYQIGFGGISDFVIGPKKAHIDTVRNDLNAFYEDFLNTYEKPYYVEAKYENVDGETVITYRGEVTDSSTGNLVAFDKEFRYDFIITDKIIANESDTLQYFS